MSAIRPERTGLWPVTAAIALALAPAVAGADEDGSQEAKALFEQAIEVYGQGDLEGAIDLMRQSYLTDTRPVVLYNLAVLEIEAELWIAAGNHLHMYLETEENISPGRRLDITTIIEEQIRSSAALIQITGIEVGADVLVNGTNIGAAGIRWGWWVEPGTHEVSVPGGASKTVQAEQGETLLVQVEPPPQPRRLLPGWLIGGAGLAVGATGAILLGLASWESGRVSDAPDGTEWFEVDGSYTRARSFSISAAVLLAAGGLAMVSAVILLAVTARANRDLFEQQGLASAWVAPMLYIGAAGLVVGGEF